MTEKIERTLLLTTEGKHGILIDGHNWVVASLKTGTSPINVRREDFDNSSYTYHVNIQQAIIELSRRLLKDSLSKACRGKVLTLQELANIIRENDQWMRKAIMGRERT